MIKELKEFGVYVAITAFRDAEIENVRRFFDLVRKNTADVEIQFFNANLIASWEHLYFATLNALTALRGKMNISNSLAMETLLYASAQRQIDKAIDLLGIKPESTEIAVLVVAKTSGEVDSALETISKMVPQGYDDSILELTDEKIEKIRQLFGVSDLELESKLERRGLEKGGLVDLVIEHMALLVTQR